MSAILLILLSAACAMAAACSVWYGAHALFPASAWTPAIAGPLACFAALAGAFVLPVWLHSTALRFLSLGKGK